MTRRTTIVPPDASFNFVLPVQPFAREIICVCLEVEVGILETFQPRVEIRDRSANLLFASQCLADIVGAESVIAVFGPSFPMVNSTATGPTFMAIPIPANLQLPPVGQLTVFTGVGVGSNIRQMALETIDEEHDLPDAA